MDGQKILDLVRATIFTAAAWKMRENLSTIQSPLYKFGLIQPKLVSLFSSTIIALHY